MQIVTPLPIINNIIRLIQEHQAGAIAAVLSAQTESLGTGFEYVSSLAEIKEFEREVNPINARTPVCTILGQTEFLDPRLNEGANVRHEITCEIYFTSPDQEFRAGAAYLYGQMIHYLLLELVDPEEFLTGLTRSRSVRLIERQLLFGSVKLENRKAFEGGAVFVFNLDVMTV